jgi:hypothetical protein
VALGDLGTWLDGACSGADPCFDIAYLRFDPEVPLLDAAHAMASLQRHAQKPLYYFAVVGPAQEVPEAACAQRR